MTAGKRTPTPTKLRIGGPIKTELVRAAALLEMPQRAIVERLLAEHLTTFVRDELAKLEASGVISARERAEREAQLATPIGKGQPDTPEEEHVPATLDGMLRRLAGQLLSGTDYSSGQGESKGPGASPPS